MSDVSTSTLRDGTLVRHKDRGYQGSIEGTTSIKACFTQKGVPLQTLTSKESFQYRIVVAGEAMRQIAPLEDLQVLDLAAVIDCVACHKPFCTKPTLVGKPSGRCVCEGWICPVCLACQTKEAAQDKATACVQQRKRFLRKVANSKKNSSVKA